MSTAATDPPYTVVVGVSGTSKSRAAVIWAAAQASANHGRLIAVRVLKRVPSPEAPTSVSSQRPLSEPLSSRSAHDTATAYQQADLAADIAETLGSSHQAECRVLYGGTRKCLLAAARSADLLVIDAARTPSSSSMLAHRIIAAAGCPVVVLPPALTHEPPPWIVKAGQVVGQTALRALGTSGRPGYHPPE
ncbi:universal stress protein [Dermatophilaceae bacterium Sec6.4]|nr:universal stress protein [Actinomycetota bacterium]